MRCAKLNKDNKIISHGSCGGRVGVNNNNFGRKEARFVSPNSWWEVSQSRGQSAGGMAQNTRKCVRANERAVVRRRDIDQ